MKITKIKNNRKGQSGFTLIELLVVVLIIGILAAIAVPQYFKVVEKGKAAEAMAILDSIRGAQERYLATNGNYCAGDPTAAAAPCAGWDLPAVTMKYFTVSANMAPAGGAGVAPSWNMTLQRRNPAPAGYGQYTITYNVTSGNAPTFACPQSTCQGDLMPQ